MAREPVVLVVDDEASIREVLRRAWRLGREALRVLVQAAPARLDLTGVQARELLAERRGITHATLQVEPDDHHGCQDVSW